MENAKKKLVVKSILAVAFYVAVFLFLTRKAKMEKAIEARKAI